MKLGRSLFYGRLWLVTSLLGWITSVLVIEPARAQQVVPTKNIASLSEIELPPKSASMLVQATATPQVVQVTGVKVNPTPQGAEVILETSGGEQLQVLTSSYGRTFVANIVNTQLALPEGKAFRALDPVTGITAVTVTQQTANSIRVSVTGKTSVPTATVVKSDRSLALSLSAPVVPTAQQLQPIPEQSPPEVPEAVEPESETQPEATTVEPEGDTPSPSTTEQPAESAPEEEEIEVVVTGERENGYKVLKASAATRTDTPTRDIPQSIQIIPQQVIEDQQATRLIEALQNAPGVVQGGISPRTYSNVFNIRGFDSSENILVNGLPDPTNQNVGFGANIEQVEVLKGPASVLFGQGGLGGRVNLVTKQPLSDPFYSVETAAGSYDFYRGALDLSGPLNESGTVLYRLNASAQTTESFIDFYEQQRYLIAPILSWQIGDRTKLTLEADYSAVEGPFDFGIPAAGSVLPNPNGEIHRDRYIGEPNIDNSQNQVFRTGFDFEHRFSNNWKMRSVFKASFLQLDREIVFSRGAEALQSDGRKLNRIFDDQDYDENIYNLDAYAVGNFAAGSIQHQLVAGINLFRYDTNTVGFTRSIAPIDVFNPVYGATPTGIEIPGYDITNRTQQLGLYLQDLISLTANLKILLGGRFDIASQDFQDVVADTEDFKQEEAFSPRVGIVYQPIEPISLYASYSRSFNQATSTFSAAEAEPERGEQYEIGIKADLTDQLAATLAFYDLSRSNLPTTDPNNSLLTVQVGEQRSRGIELDISGKILPGWNIIAGYAYTDAEIIEDNDFAAGNRLNNVPEHAFNLWTTYEIQSGKFQGLGFGLGVFYFGERQGDLANTFELPSYVRTDAAIFYNRNNFRAALNIRNLFDVDYFVSAQNLARVFPGDPLTFVGTVSWEF